MTLLGRAPARLLTLGALVLTMTFMSTRPAAADVPLPQQHAPTGNCANDNIYYGAVPPGSNATRVLVFVHGLGGQASDWWTTPPRQADIQDMWQVAYNAGYRTAYVSMGFRPGNADCSTFLNPQNSVADDGVILAQQIDTITKFYGVTTLDVIAHSKGGVDTQAAIVNYTPPGAPLNPPNNAAAEIRDVFFLGSPHQGSLVADAACPILAKKGFPDPATCSLQTPVMQQQFRPFADASPLNANVHYYSGVGDLCRADNTSACNPDQPLPVGGMVPGGATMLNKSPNPPTFGGPNDNIVTVAETQLAYSTPLFLQSWSHYQTTVGHLAFPYIQQILASQANTVFVPVVAH